MTGIKHINHSAGLELWKVFGVAFALVAVSFAVQGTIGLNLSDEGYLWYGVLRTAEGEVPIRDFQAYDPGRYYWTAAWSAIFGHGITGVRLSVAVFQALGLSCGLIALRRLYRTLPGILLSGLLLLVWMIPRHKLFEHSLAMMLVAACTMLIENPTVARHFLVGLAVGVTAFFGRNLGLYGLAGTFIAILIASIKIDRTQTGRKLSAWISGIAAGYSPMLVMILAVSGFWESFYDSIIYVLFVKGTNYFLPLPLPWRGDYSHMPLADGLQYFSTGTIFILMFIFPIAAVLWTLRAKRDAIIKAAPVIAASCIGLFYAHHAYSRADLPHIAQSVHPVLIGCLALAAIVKRGSWHKSAVLLLIVAVAGLSIFSALLNNPLSMKISQRDGRYVSIMATKDTISVPENTAGLINTMNGIARERLDPGEQMFIAPDWTAFYPILGMHAPFAETYLVHVETPQRQKLMIEILKDKNIRWIVLGDIPLDGRDEFRFRNTHNVLWEYINAHYETVSAPGLPPAYQLMGLRN